MNWQVIAILIVCGIVAFSWIPGVNPPSIPWWWMLIGAGAVLLLPGLIQGAGGTGTGGGAVGGVVSGAGKFLGRIWAAPFFLIALAAAVLAVGYIWPGARGNFWWEFRLWIPLGLAILAFASQGGVSPGIVRGLSIIVILFIGWHFWTERRWEAVTDSGEVWVFRIDNGSINPEQFDRFTFTAGEFVKVTVEGDYTVTGLVTPNGRIIAGKQFIPGNFRFEKTNFHGEVRPLGEVQILSGDTPLQGINVSGDKSRLTILGTALTGEKLNIGFNGVPDICLVSGTVRVKVTTGNAVVAERKSRAVVLAESVTAASERTVYHLPLFPDGNGGYVTEKFSLAEFRKAHPGRGLEIDFPGKNGDGRIEVRNDYSQYFSRVPGEIKISPIRK